MKPILLIALVIISIKGFSQLKVENCTSQSWMSGVCCSGGTNYRISISGSMDVIESINITSVGIEGSTYTRPRITKLIQPKDSTSYMIIEFSNSYSRTNKEYIIDEIIEKPKKIEEGVFYTLHGVNAKLAIGKIETLISIPYP